MSAIFLSRYTFLWCNNHTKTPFLRIEITGYAPQIRTRSTLCSNIIIPYFITDFNNK